MLNGSGIPFAIWFSRGLEDDAAGEHDVADAAVEAFEETATVVLVEEVVEGHGEGNHALVFVVAVGEGEGEVEAPAALDHGFVEGAPAVPAAGAAEGMVVEDTRLEGLAVFAEDDAGAGLEVVATQVGFVIFEAEFLALVVGTGIEAHEGGHAGGIKADAAVSEVLKGVAERTVVRTVDIVGVGVTLLGDADGEYEIATGDDGVGNWVVVECPMHYCALCDAVEEGRPIVGGPGAGVEGELAFALLCGDGRGKNNCHNYN